MTRPVPAPPRRPAAVPPDRPLSPVPVWAAEAPVRLGECRDGGAPPTPLAPSPTTMFGPRGCCLLGGDGPLWVADSGHHRLLGWQQCPREDRVPADWVIGQPDFVSEGRNAKQVPGRHTLHVPTGLTTYRGGLAVADAWNHRVLIWRQVPDRSHCPPDLVLGQDDFASVELNRGQPIPSASSLYWPSGVAAWGNSLLVADTGNRRVLVWHTKPERNGQPADLVLGQPRFDRREENAGGPPNAMSMRWPHAIVRWGARLCVADAGNSRIMVWDALPSMSGAPCRWILGQSTTTEASHNQGATRPSARSLNMPYALAAAGAWLLVADTGNSRLLGWREQDLETGAAARGLGGQPSFERQGEDVWSAGSAEQLCWPYGLALGDDMIAIADSGNNRVLIRRLHEQLSP